ncbi:distribution and morphology protein 35 [Rhizophagus clarus]|uniref:Distribution and morphology protein 35 n=1 Tax=Rhizophagus clarus TaxID=94130 RepID=A0A8H3QII4_9GLOM|nr:distribution and morphology protein 35 [Rhizophagus clarus]
MSQSIGSQCNELKKEYDTCFNKWYSEKFLKGDVRPECEELFKKYKDCVMIAVKQKQIDKLLVEARKDDPFISSSSENKGKRAGNEKV